MSDPDGIENADSVSDQIRNPPPAPPLPSVTVAAQVHSGANDDDDNKESATTGKRGVGSRSYPDDSSSSDEESDEEGADLAWTVPPHSATRFLKPNSASIAFKSASKSARHNFPS